MHENKALCEDEMVMELSKWLFQPANFGLISVCPTKQTFKMVHVEIMAFEKLQGAQGC